MQAIFLIGYMFIFSLDETYSSSKCYKSRICIHSNNVKCGRNNDGEVRRFLDSCDMKEFNCLKNTNYIPTDEKECEDLPKPKDNVSEPDRSKSVDSEVPEEHFDNINDGEEELLEINKTAELEVQDENVDVMESAKSDEHKNESVENANDANGDVANNELRKDVVEEFDPTTRNEVKKMSHRVTKSFNAVYDDSSSEDKSSSSEDENSSSEDENNDVNHEDYYFNKPFFFASTRTY